MKKMLILFFAILLSCMLLTACDLLPAGIVPDFLKPDSATTSVTTVTEPAPPAVSVLSVNGHALSEYTIVTTAAAMRDAERLSDLLFEKYGVRLNVATEASGLQILLAKNDNLAITACELCPTDTGIAVYGTGVNATYLAAMALCDRLAKADETAGKNLSVTATLYCSVASYLPEGTLNLLENRILNRDYEGELNIAFLGGSLTQDKRAWTEPVADFFRNGMPSATVNTLNAGIGATDSECGALRFQKDVLDKMIPDILFIDYAVNDGGYTEEGDAAIIKNGAYIESIIKQCRELEKPPVIILLYFPLGQRGTEENKNYVKWKNGTELKDSLAEHYGIGTIDVWAYFEKLYQKELKSNSALTYDQFLSQYYAPTDLVHPITAGFEVFGEAIVKALKSDLTYYLINKVDPDTYFEDFSDIVNFNYTLLTPTEALAYTEGSFTHYTGAAHEKDDPAYIPALRVSATQLSDGVLQIEDGSDFAITLTTTARAIKLYGMNSPDGMKLDVLSDGVCIGTINTKENNTYLYTEGVMIPDDGKQSHTITVRPSEDNEGSVFRFGYIVLCE